MIYEIYTPDALFDRGDAFSITFSLPDGELCVLDGHAPAFLSLTVGNIIITSKDKTKICRSGNGSAAIKDVKVSVFVESCEETDKKEKVIYQTEKRYKRKDKTVL